MGLAEGSELWIPSIEKLGRPVPVSFGTRLESPRYDGVRAAGLCISRGVEEEDDEKDAEERHTEACLHLGLFMSCLT